MPTKLEARRRSTVSAPNRVNIVRAKKIVEDEDGVYAYPPVPGMHLGRPSRR